jgi:peptidyl-dipeptidase Dcp
MRESFLLMAGLMICSATVAEGQALSAPANPITATWTGAYGGVPPWDRLSPDLFGPAFETALAELRAETAAIASSPASPTFENTLAAMERSGRTLDRAMRLFGVMRDNVGTPAYQTLAREWQPRLAAANDEIVFNTALFARISAVHAAAATSGLTPEQVRLVTRTYESFVRQGAALDAPAKARLSTINQRLAALFSEFNAKVLADENTWIVLEQPADLAGLPASLVSAAAAAATDRKLPGKWVIVNTRSSVDPFLTFSTRRDLRERVWKAFKNRGENGDANDTRAVIAEIVRLRSERARLLGYATHAHWRMADTMAKTPDAATALMMRVWPAAVGRVKEEVADMQAIADRDQANLTIEPWDYLFYAERVRKARYDLDQGELRPYFQLDNMVAGALWAAEQRYDLKFTEITGKVPVFHPDVRVWEVTDVPSGRHRGLFYLDNFARPGKRSGAWANTYRTQRTLDGPQTALASNNNNFIKGAPGEPTLISLDDARTLFHEFGHALHSLLQNITYPGLSVTPRDYVEFPSQVNEQWLLTREVLDRFARHYQTNAAMPQALVDKIHESAKFNQGYATVEYLAAAIVDMDLHTRRDEIGDAAAIEREVLARIGMPREIALRHRLPHFSHLFASDAYSAGYYSYLWSEVMAADAWTAFTEGGGPWDKAVAGRMRQFILGDGNSTDRAEAYRRFRGRDPDVKALFDDRGFPTPSN